MDSGWLQKQDPEEAEDGARQEPGHEAPDGRHPHHAPLLLPLRRLRGVDEGDGAEVARAEGHGQVEDQEHSVWLDEDPGYLAIIWSDVTEEEEGEEEGPQDCAEEDNVRSSLCGSWPFEVGS